MSLVGSPGQGLKRTLDALVATMGPPWAIGTMLLQVGRGSARDDDDAIMHPAKNFFHALRHGPSGDRSKGLAWLVVW